MQRISTMLCTIVMLFGMMMMAPGTVLAAVTADVYVPVVTENEVSVFLETKNDAAAVYVWNGNVNPVIEHAGKWNEATAKQLPLVGKSASGKNIFKWTYTGPESQLPTHLIFLDGKGSNDGNKITGNVEYVNHGYYIEGKYEKTITPGPEDKVMVFFDNSTANLADVYCYIYDGTKAAQVWPGLKMSFDDETVYNGKKGYYTVEVPTAFVTGYFVINNGKDGSTLTGETVYISGQASSIENTTLQEVKKTEDNAWYTLTGMRISKPTQPGLYIHNGKKVIIRK
nr:starch-binding protein [uncultured Prevotella sp.]